MARWAELAYCSPEKAIAHWVQRHAGTGPTPSGACGGFVVYLSGSGVFRYGFAKGG